MGRGLALVPHQLFPANNPPWCVTSARGAGPPSALDFSLAEHPPSIGESLPYNPSVPLAEACCAEGDLVGGALFSFGNAVDQVCQVGGFADGLTRLGTGLDEAIHDFSEGRLERLPAECKGEEGIGH